MLLLGPVALKLGSVGYRFARYYAGGEEYTRSGPPLPVMRFFVAPILVASTITLFATGVLLLAVPQRGTVLLLHKASFIVWIAATAIHVLVYLKRALRHIASDLLSPSSAGRMSRLLLLVGATIGLIVALSTYSLAQPWLRHRV
jgi:hypothetical protein